MKALTLTEPWATLVAIGAKRIETRSWSANYRGPLAIHAAKGMPGWAEDCCYEEPFFSVLREVIPAELLRQPATRWFQRGSVIATCHLTDCLPITAEPSDRACVAPDEEGLMRAWAPFDLAVALGNERRIHGSSGGMTTEHEAAFGDYGPGRFGWLLTDVKRLPQPAPAKGSLGLWEWQP